MREQNLLADAINNVMPILPLGEGGRKLRGPNRLFDFVYQVWCEKAIMQTRMLPAMLELERQKYLKHKKLMEDIGHKGLYTNTYGWSKSREFLHDFSLSTEVYNYFANVVGPFLGFGKHIWSSENSRMYRRIKSMIVSGDKRRIAKFARDIERRLIKERGKKIMGVVNGPKAQGSITE